MEASIHPLILAALMRGLTAEIPHETWHCSNQLEVWCTADGCASTELDAFTPMAVTADAHGGFSVCAYSGCWDGEGPPVESGGRLLWTGDGVPFSTRPEGGMAADVTLLLVERDGVGFVRVAGFATPLLCERTGPELRAPGDETRKGR